TLHHQLLGSMAGGGEKTSADDSRPKAVASREELRQRADSKIEHLKLAERSRDRRYVPPSSWNFTKQDQQAQRRSADIQEHLHHVGPDDRGHAALVGVEQR